MGFKEVDTYFLQPFPVLARLFPFICLHIASIRGLKAFAGFTASKQEEIGSAFGHVIRKNDGSGQLQFMTGSAFTTLFHV